MKKILIVVDVLNDFVNGALGTKEAELIIPDVILKIKEAIKNGDKIIFLRDTHYDNYLETNEGQNLPVAHAIKGTHGWEIADELRKEIDTDKYPNIEKTTFACVGLKEYLEEIPNLNEYEIDMIGICTGICVISNAFFIKALYPEMKINVYEKCCACVTPESQKKAMDVMKLCHINIVE